MDLRESLLPRESDSSKSEKRVKTREMTSIPHIIRFAFPMLWTEASTCTRLMTVLAFVSLGVSKLVKVASPLALKYAVDTLTVAGS